MSAVTVFPAHEEEKKRGKTPYTTQSGVQHTAQQVLCSIQSDSCPWARRPSIQSLSQPSRLHLLLPAHKADPGGTVRLGTCLQTQGTGPHQPQPLQNPVVPAGSRNTTKLLECPIEAFLAPELLRLVESSRDEATEIGETSLS